MINHDVLATSLRPTVKRLAIFTGLVSLLAGCVPSESGGNGNPSTNDNTNDNNANDNTSVGGVNWGRAFDGFYTGALTSVWGADANNIYAVGGQADQCEIYKYDGTTWRAQSVPNDQVILAWVYGFSANDVYAVGEEGGVLHFDGTSWTALESGTDEDLWGVWGRSGTDLWIVGGDTRDTEPPVILHYDGSAFTRVDAPANDRNATALFAVYGVDDKIFAVGSLGLIIEYNSATETWSQVNSGAAANQDFLGIYGTAEDHFVAVGGRAPSGARIATYDGTSWNTIEPPDLLGLSTVFIGSDDKIIVGGPDGYVADFNFEEGSLIPEASGASDSIRGVWGLADASAYFVVGGSFGDPHAGVAVMRKLGGAPAVGQQPDANGDGLPDAPLTVAGERPDDVIVPPNGNDNSPPPDGVQLTFGTLGDGGVFEEIAEGGEMVLDFNDQDGIYFFNPILRVVGFPAEAANKFVDYSFTLTLESSGEVIAELSGARPITTASGAAGALDLRLVYFPESALTEEDLVGQAIEFSVTVTYSAVTPPATGSITQTFVAVSPPVVE